MNHSGYPVANTTPLDALRRATTIYERRPNRLPTPIVSLGLVGALAAPVLFIAGGLSRPLDAVVASMMVLFAIAASAKNPSALPLIVFVYFVGNRLVRRLLDFAEGEFSEMPPTSLVVPAISLLMLATALTQRKTLPKQLQDGTRWFLWTMAYGAVVGVGWGAGMVFDLISWLAPFGYGLYVAWLRPSTKQLYQWVGLFGAITAVGMVYGWVQWLTLPPWDEFWVIHCGMGSIGAAEPMKCRFFGPFGAHGSAACASALTAALLIIVPCGTISYRTALAAFLSISSLATGVRSAWLAAGAIVIAFALLKRGGGLRLLAPLAVACAIGTVAFPSLPGAESMGERMDSLTNLSQDRSLQARIAQSWWAVQEIAGRPLGFGLGSSGIGAMRLTSGGVAAFDSGYLQLPYTLGVPGMAMFLAALSKLVWPPLSKAFWRSAPDKRIANVVRAVIFGEMVLMIVSNVLRDDTAILFWMFVLTAHTTPFLITSTGQAAPQGQTQPYEASIPSYGGNVQS